MLCACGIDRQLHVNFLSNPLMYFTWRGTVTRVDFPKLFNNTMAWTHFNSFHE